MNLDEMPNVLQTHLYSFLHISKLKIFKQAFPENNLYIFGHTNLPYRSVHNRTYKHEEVEQFN